MSLKSEMSFKPRIVKHPVGYKGRKSVLEREDFETALHLNIPDAEVLRRFRGAGVTRHVWYTTKGVYREEFSALIEGRHRKRLSYSARGNTNGSRPPSTLIPLEKLRPLVEAGKKVVAIAAELGTSEHFVRRAIRLHGLAKTGELPNRMQKTDLPTLQELDSLAPGFLGASKAYYDDPGAFYEKLYEVFGRLSQLLWFVQYLSMGYSHYRETKQLPKSHICWSKNRAELTLSLALLSEGVQHIRQFFFYKRFMADFAWPEKRLLVEVDGEYHEACERTKQTDRRKQKAADRLGYMVIRFSTKEVLGDPRGVVDSIKSALSEA